MTVVDVMLTNTAPSQSWNDSNWDCSIYDMSILDLIPKYS